jgi:hypothetical protein
MMVASWGNRMNAGIIVSDMAKKPTKKPKPDEIETASDA